MDLAYWQSDVLIRPASGILQLYDLVPPIVQAKLSDFVGGVPS